MPMQKRRIRQLGAAILVLSLAVFSTSRANQRGPLTHEDQPACNGEIYSSPCILYDVFAGLDPQSRAIQEALLSLRPPPTLSTRPPGGKSPEANGQALAFEALWLDHTGATPDLALTPVEAFQQGAAPIKTRLFAYRMLCSLAARARRAELGDVPGLESWIKFKPSGTLLKTAAERWERALADPGAPHPDPLGRGDLSACFAFAGDGATADRLYDLALRNGDHPLPEVGRIASSTRLALLRRELRLEDAVAFSETAKAEDLVGNVDVAWSRLQQERVKLLFQTRQAGRDDLALRVANSIIAAIEAPDRPTGPYVSIAPTELGPALTYLVAHDDRTRVRAEVARLDARVRPGGDYFNPDDAVAIHWAWGVLGQPDRARSIFDAMADHARAEDHNDPHFLALMLASDGRYDEALKLGLSAKSLLFEDLQWGVGARNVEAHLQRATTAQESQEILALCAAPVNPFVDADARTSGPLPYGREAEPPLDIAASCARRLEAPGWVGLVVALRAARAGRLDLMRNLREQGLKTLHDEPTGLDMNLVMAYLAETAVIDLNSPPRTQAVSRSGLEPRIR